jgi:hypothetical protein
MLLAIIGSLRLKSKVSIKQGGLMSGKQRIVKVAGGVEEGGATAVVGCDSNTCPVVVDLGAGEYSISSTVYPANIAYLSTSEAQGLRDMLNGMVIGGVGPLAVGGQTEVS